MGTETPILVYPNLLCSFCKASLHMQWRENFTKLYALHPEPPQSVLDLDIPFDFCPNNAQRWLVDPVRNIIELVTF